MERKVAHIYPGQGLAPKDVVGYYNRLKALDLDLVKNRINFTQEVVNKELGSNSFHLSSALEDEAAEDFKKTSFVQPAVYTLSVLATEIMKAQNPERSKPDFVAGHSLGEYSALTEAEVFHFEQGIEIVAFRGNVVQQSCDTTPSTLVSINGLDEEQVRESLKQTSAEIALINSPELIVVGVAKEEAEGIVKLALEKQAKRASVLDVAGAFHTKTFMQEAANLLDQFLRRYEFNNPEIPLVANLTGEISRSGLALSHHLVESLINPVRWAKSIQTMKNSGVEEFIEAGPGRSLVALNRLNNIPEDQTINILDKAS